MTTSLTAETLVEAIDGPTKVGTLEGKSMPILTRLPNGKLGFRIMGKFVKGPAASPVVRVAFENGQSVRVGRDQLFFRNDMAEVAAGELRPGDALVPSWDYRDGYAPPDLPEQRPADGALRVVSITPEGEAETFSAPIRETGRFFLTCGVMLKA
jgi:hypothetical protein